MAGIAATITAGGLKCTAVRDDAQYRKGTAVSDERMKHLQDCDLDRDPFRGEWNYTIRAVPRDAPQPEPEPERPGRIPAAVLNCPALTGMAPQDITALAAALEVPFGARREQHNYSRRGRARVNAVRNGGGPSASSRLALADYVLAVRLRDHLNLPMEATAVLLGVDRTTGPARRPAAGRPPPHPRRTTRARRGSRNHPHNPPERRNNAKALQNAPPETATRRKLITDKPH